MHTVWSGYISFGLVNIPVRAVAARADHDLRLQQLHRECRSPLRQRKGCPACGCPSIPADELTRSVRVAAGRHVLVSREEVQSLGTPARKTLSLLDFVHLDEVDPLFFEKPYFLRPGEGGERPYALLVRSLGEGSRVGIGKVALRDREHLALIRPVRHALVMHLMAFPDEVRSVEQAVPPPREEPDPQAQALVRLLIDAMTRPFAGERYQDARMKNLRELLDRKIADQYETTRVPAEVRPEVGALMEMLRRQVELAAA